MRKHFPLDPTSGVENAALLPWMDGVPASGTEGSYPGHALVTDSEAELLNVLAAAGLSTSPTDLTQVAQAISVGIFLGTLQGTANALTATLPGSVPIPLLIPGMRFTGFVGLNPNSGPATFNLAGFGSAAGIQPLTRKDGLTALAAGDLSAGAFVSVVWDGAVYRLVGLVPSDIMALIQAATRTNLTANLTLFIRCDSTATNPSGLTNTTTDAFPSIAAAYNFAAQRYNLGGYSITFTLGVPGTYAGANMPNIGMTGAVTLTSITPGSPSSFQITPIPLNDGSYANLAVGMVQMGISGVTLPSSQATGCCLRIYSGGSVVYGNVVFQYTGASAGFNIVFHDPSGVSVRNGPITIGGGGTCNAIICVSQNAIDEGTVFGIPAQNITCTGITATTFYLSSGGGLSLQNTTFPAGQVFSGLQATVSNNGVLNTVTTGLAAVPGSGISLDQSSTITNYLGLPWTYVTPTVAATGGNLTAYTAGTRYQRKGRQVAFQMQIAISNAGTGSGGITVTLPFPTAGSIGGGGKEIAVTGKTISYAANAGSSIIVITYYDNSYPGGSGCTLNLSGVYDTNS